MVTSVLTWPGSVLMEQKHFGSSEPSAVTEVLLPDQNQVSLGSEMETSR